MTSWNRIEQPEKEILELDRVKTTLRIISATSADDTMLKSYITAGREYVEDICGISIMSQKWRYSLDHFPHHHGMVTPLELPRCSPPGCAEDAVTSIDKFTYIDEGGNSADFSSYLLDVESRPPRIYPKVGQVFPLTMYTPNAVQIEFTAGCTDTDEVPESLKVAVLFMIGHFWDNREPVIFDKSVEKIPYALEALIWRYRVPFNGPPSHYLRSHHFKHLLY